MTTLQFITSPTHGCCTTSELMAFSKQDKDGFEKLKEYARIEMSNKGLGDTPVTQDMMVPKIIQ